MNFSFPKIFRQAFEIATKNRFLWLFGLFLVLGNYPFFSFIFRSRDKEGFERDSAQITDWLNNNLFWSNVIFIGLLVVIFFLVLLYFHAKAANIVAIKAIIDKEQTSFSKASKAGGFFRGRLIGVSFLSLAACALVIVILAAPIIYLFAIDYVLRGLVLLLLALMIFLTSMVMIWFINILASMFVVIYDQKIWESIRAAFSTFVRFWPKLVLFGFFLLSIGLGIFFLSLFIAGLVASLFVLFAYIFYDEGGLITQTILPLLGLITACAVFLITQAVLAVFRSASWVLVFLQLIKPEKLEEKNSIVSVSEIVS